MRAARWLSLLSAVALFDPATHAAETTALATIANGGRALSESASDPVALCGDITTDRTLVSTRAREP